VASKIIKWPQREMFRAFSSCCRNLWIKAISVKELLLALNYFLFQLQTTGDFVLYIRKNV